MASEGSAGRVRDGKARLQHPCIHWQRPARIGATGEKPRQIVSLVPSLSEALVALGLRDRLVGVTEYCVEPPGAFAALPKLGGTKDADVEAIVALGPDLVIANQEENTPRVVGRLAEAGIDVWVTHPHTVAEGARLLAELAELGAEPAARGQVVEPVLEAVAAAEQKRAARSKQWRAGEAGARGPRVFCPIWRDPWMTIGADTYVHDLIELCGGLNVFGGSGESAEADVDPAGGAGGTGAVGPSADIGAAGVPAGGGAPGEATGAAGHSRVARAQRRYPIVRLEAVVAAQPEVILLPDEPYAFGPADAEELGKLEVPAAASGRIVLIDGSLVSWYGPRIAKAIRRLAGIFANP